VLNLCVFSENVLLCNHFSLKCIKNTQNNKIKLCLQYYSCIMCMRDIRPYMNVFFIFAFSSINTVKRQIHALVYFNMYFTFTNTGSLIFIHCGGINSVLPILTVPHITRMAKKHDLLFLRHFLNITKARGGDIFCVRFFLKQNLV